MFEVLGVRDDLRDEVEVDRHAPSEVVVEVVGQTPVRGAGGHGQAGQGGGQDGAVGEPSERSVVGDGGEPGPRRQAGSGHVDVGGGEYAVRRRQRFSPQPWSFWWAQAPARSAITAARIGFLGQVGHPGSQPCRTGLPGEVEHECGEVAKVGQVSRRLDGLPEHGDRLPGEGSVNAALQSKDILAGGCRGDRREVVLALLGGAGTERVPAHCCGADAAQVGVALVAELPPTGRAPSDQERTVSGAGGDDEEPPRGLPGTVLGEARRADLGAVGWCPSAGGDLPVGVPVARVETVRSRAVPSNAARVAAYTWPSSTRARPASRVIVSDDGASVR